MSVTDLATVPPLFGFKTPLMTSHARERCEQMGISTKVAKQIVRHAGVVRPCSGVGSYGLSEVRVATSLMHPDYAVIFDTVDDDPQQPIVITVVFQERERYERDGYTYQVVV